MSCYVTFKTCLDIFLGNCLSKGVSGRRQQHRVPTVREKSGNFEFSQGNLKFWQKSGNFRIRSRWRRNQVIRGINEKMIKWL